MIICWCVFVHGPSTGPALQLISVPCTTHVVLCIVCASPYVPFHAPTALTKNQRAFYALSWKRAAAGAWNNHGGVFCDFLIQYLGFIPFLDLATFLFGSSVKRPCKFRCYNLIEPPLASTTAQNLDGILITSELSSSDMIESQASISITRSWSCVRIVPQPDSV